MKRKTQGSWTAREPGWIENAVAYGAGMLAPLFGGDERAATQYMNDKVKPTLEFTPGVGDAMAAAEARDAFTQGDYLGGGLLTAGAIAGLVPGAGDVVQKGAKRAAKALKSGDVYAEAAQKIPQKRSHGAFVGSDKDIEGELFDYSLLDQAPNRPQAELERYRPKKETDRLKRALSDPRTEKELLKYVARGESLGGRKWYNTEPMRRVFDEEWGSAADPKYKEYMDIMAATSPRSKVTDNIRTQSMYWNQLNENPNAAQVDLPDAPPKGYGSVAQKLHRGNVDKLLQGGMDPRKNPKPISFSENLQGNWAPATIDTHNFRPLGMVTEDPDFMMRSMNLEKGKTINPRKMYDEGQVSMEEALRQPTYWDAKPRENEYAVYEDWQRDQATKLGMTPAEFQASMWIGAGDLTGLQSAPEPFLRTMERRVQYTADRLGLNPEEVLRRHVRGEIPLLSVGGAGLLAAGLGAGDDRPQREEF